MSLEGRVIVITGGTGGIGSATAQLCAARGASVVIADLDEAAGDALAEKIRECGGKAAFIRTDVTSEADVEAMVAFAVSEFGGLHGAFNNAGINSGNVVMTDHSLDQWQRGIGVNLTGVFLCLKHEIRHMSANGGGAIVNTSSTAGARGFAMCADYVSSKHGVVGITRAAAVEYGKQGIRVNAVLPGATETQMFLSGLETNPNLREITEAGHPIGRVGQPSELAESVAWLLSDSASYVTGVALPVDGGFTAQ
ncbi:MAG: glucose 1-dehydrogenase [Novosphingobium sp.]|nr:glucose 1-dehydrogenase [Novosphingobium sp.]